MNTPARLQQSFTSGAPWLFLSPHLDDAVLSCAGLIEAHSGTREITVATIFTAAEPPPHTRAARTFLAQCSAHDATTLFENRRKEDQTALAGLRTAHRHLGAVDALFRQRVWNRNAIGPFVRWIPELVHLYPTYRLDIALGRISRHDARLMRKVHHAAASLMEETGAELLFCPVGVGRHVDHLITRAVGQAFPDQVVYYSDFPYNQTATPDARFLQEHGLRSWTWHPEPKRKNRHINQYTSQAPALFPDGRVPVAPEIYFAAD